MVAKMATMFGDVTDLHRRHHPLNIPHLVEKTKGFPLKAKSFRNTATYPKLWGGVPPSTTVGVWICVYVQGLMKSLQRDFAVVKITDHAACGGFNFCV